MARFALVDLNNLYYRAAKGCVGNAFDKSAMGMHITFLSFRKMIHEFDCDHLVVCAEGHSWRYEVFPQYKARRKLDRAAMTAAEREDDAIIQQGLNDLMEYLANHTRLTYLRSSRAEGDDYIGRFIQLHPNDEHIILSSDSDFIQLIDKNVSIYDAMLDRHITPSGVKDSKGRDMVFEINSSKGKIKVLGVYEELAETHRREQKRLLKENLEHEVTEYTWSIEEDWWKLALFVKLIRGDSGDGVFSSYPGVRYKGTKNKVGIENAWNDRHVKGWEWNNFMNTTWHKSTGEVNDKDEDIMVEVVVRDAIEFNRKLIDLTAQPADVIAEMDETIVAAIQRPPVESLGSKFLSFCAKNQLKRLAQEANQHGRYLNAGYPMMAD